MAFIPIWQAIQQQKQRGPGGEMSKLETIVVVTVTVIAILFLMGWGIIAVLNQKDFEKHQALVHEAWDMNIGRPESVQVLRGKAATVPHTIAQVNEYWDSCNRKTCRYADIQRYPNVYTADMLHFDDNGCFTGTSDIQPNHIRVAATHTSSVYNVSFDSDGRHFHVCAAAWSDQDQLVVWSDDIPK